MQCMTGTWLLFAARLYSPIGALCDESTFALAWTDAHDDQASDMRELLGDARPFCLSYGINLQCHLPCMLRERATAQGRRVARVCVDQLCLTGWSGFDCESARLLARFAARQEHLARIVLSCAPDAHCTSCAAHPFSDLTLALYQEGAGRPVAQVTLLQDEVRGNDEPVFQCAQRARHEHFSAIFEKSLRATVGDAAAAIVLRAEWPQAYIEYAPRTILQL
jgi:hypothetical protein